MTYLLRGALIEYGEGLVASIPNVFIFQFNPEGLNRTMRIPQRPSGANKREQTQAGDPTFESISVRAHFSAADMLNDNKVLARAFGLGPQLSALEKMVQPISEDGLLGQAVDAIGDALGLGGDEEAVMQPVPRQQYPRLLFIWGLSRVLPVTIESLQISELEYDFVLNPVRAEVEMELTVSDIDNCSDDWLAKGALAYSQLARDTQAVANLANSAEQVVELIPI